MIPWKIIKTPDDVKAIAEASKTIPCIIYKHSTRCDLSAIALYSLQSDWNFSPTELQPYFLDIFQTPELSQLVATIFQVYHESPQVLLIRNGECTYENSHLDISIEELREYYDDKPFFD